MPPRTRARIALISLILLVAAALAPAIAAEESDSATALDAAAEPTIEVLEVHAHPLSGEGLSQAAVTLDGEDLERERADSVGATVASQPGVNSAAFGEAVGRPVIHGMSGARVRIMEDRIDTMDASVTSGDHATAVDPYVANRIEVLKGPSTLLYGAGAIGGVVDVHTGRIPHGRNEALSGRVEVRAADNGGQEKFAFRLDGGGEAISWHLDGFSRSADEYDIPGFAESARFRAAEEHDEEHEEEGHHDEEEEGEHEEEHHEDEHEEEEAFGTLPGSQTDGQGGAFGVSIVGDWGFAGFAVSTLRYDYGLPGGHGHHGEEEHHDEHDDEHEEGHHDDEDEEEGEHEEEHHEAEEGHGDEGNVTLELEQTRVDFEAGFADPFANLSSLNIRVGINDYEHIEIEPNGEVGTVFSNDAYEARAELTNNDDSGLDGVFGVQFGGREFSAIGHEAFVPPVDTGTFGAFWVGEQPFDGFDVEAGARINRTSHDPTGAASTSFTTFSASVGFVIPVGEALLGLHGDYASRAPIAEELYSHGPHPATQSFEIGDTGLDAETALNGAATLSWGTEGLELSATAYATSFADHIYQYATGEVEDGLLVAYYGQADATYRGLDLSARARLATFDGGELSGRLLFDTVAAEIDVSGNDRLPRLPASRFGAGLELDFGRVTASVDYLRVFDQDEPAAAELPTDGYDDVRAFVGIDLGTKARLFLKGRNLTDEEQRQHTSYIKEFAPLPGRTLEAGFRLAF